MSQDGGGRRGSCRGGEGFPGLAPTPGRAPFLPSSRRNDRCWAGAAAEAGAAAMVTSICRPHPPRLQPRLAPALPTRLLGVGACVAGGTSPGGGGAPPGSEGGSSASPPAGPPEPCSLPGPPPVSPPASRQPWGRGTSSYKGLPPVVRAGLAFHLSPRHWPFGLCSLPAFLLLLMGSVLGPPFFMPSTGEGW